MRGFYRVGQKAWPVKEPDQEGGTKKLVVQPVDAVVLLETTQYVYLHSARAPSPWLVENIPKAQLTLMGCTWVEFWGALTKVTREKIFLAAVMRPVQDAEPGAPEMAAARIPIAEVEAEDEWDGQALIPHAWGARESRRDQKVLNAALGS